MRFNGHFTRFLRSMGEGNTPVRGITTFYEQYGSDAEHVIKASGVKMSRECLEDKERGVTLCEVIVVPERVGAVVLEYYYDLMRAYALKYVFNGTEWVLCGLYDVRENKYYELNKCSGDEE